MESWYSRYTVGPEVFIHFELEYTRYRLDDSIVCTHTHARSLKEHVTLSVNIHVYLTVFVMSS